DYNCALVNKYRDGSDYIGPHSDSEKGLENKYIASYSLGDTRTFVLESRHNEHDRIEMDLLNNCLIAFDMFVNRRYRHSVPRKKNGVVRYNLTFRYIAPM